MVRVSSGAPGARPPSSPAELRELERWRLDFTAQPWQDGAYMGLLPNRPADSAAAAAAHLWHLTHQLGGLPGRSPELDRWRDLAAELTILSERLRAQAAGRREAGAEALDRAVFLESVRRAVAEVFARLESGPHSHEDRPGAPIGRLGPEGRAV